MKRPPKEESFRWFTQAKDEFQDADDLGKRGRFYLALFHFQQAAEKALRADLYLKVESFEVFYTHSIDDAFKPSVNAKRLDQYYIPTRYPNGLPGGVPSRYFDDPKEAEEAMDLAKGIIELVEKKIRETEP